MPFNNDVCGMWCSERGNISRHSHVYVYIMERSRTSVRFVKKKEVCVPFFLDGRACLKNGMFF